VRLEFNSLQVIVTFHTLFDAFSNLFMALHHEFQLWRYLCNCETGITNASTDVDYSPPSQALPIISINQMINIVALHSTMFAMLPKNPVILAEFVSKDSKNGHIHPVRQVPGHLVTFNCLAYSAGGGKPFFD